MVNDSVKSSVKSMSSTIDSMTLNNLMNVIDSVFNHLITINIGTDSESRTNRNNAFSSVEKARGYVGYLRSKASGFSTKHDATQYISEALIFTMVAGVSEGVIRQIVR